MSIGELITELKYAQQEHGDRGVVLYIDCEFVPIGDVWYCQETKKLVVESL